MKNYKDCKKIYLGESDSAKLMMIGMVDSTTEDVKYLKFVEDGAYDAYFADEETEIPSHYSPVAEFFDLMHIYDDNGLTVSIAAEKIEVYRAGMFGCIVRVIGEDSAYDNRKAVVY